MKKTYIIAEVAWGHCGKLDYAYKMLEGVKDAGADAIGIHLTHLKSYMTKNYNCIAGQTISNKNESLSNDLNETSEIYNYLSKINLIDDEWLLLDKKAKELNIDLIVMCNDFKSLEFSKNISVKKYVISAASFLEKGFINEILDINPHLIVRIGGATLSEIDELVNFVLSKNDKTTLELLVGIQLYPTPIKEMHIASINTLKERYDQNRVFFGLADHIDGDEKIAKYLPALALPLGIKTIEKHITIDRKLKQEDFEAALDIKEFKELVDFIKSAEIALGDGSLDYLENDSYHTYRNVSRKKVVASKQIKKGQIISKDDLSFMRSDFGCQISELESILGRSANKNISKHEGITVEDVV